MYVWPRLPTSSARVELQSLHASDPMTLRSTSALSHPEAAPVAVGGTPVTTAVISTVRDRVRALADSLGFPAELPRPSVSSFDGPATRILHEEMNIIPADAASEEVWNFLSLVVLPDVAVWRYPGRADERLLGRPRNVFRRLWWRGETIGADLIDVPRGLGEDELVGIMERPTLAANPRTARMLAQVLVERGDEVGVARSEVMRDLAKRFLRQQAVICVDILPDAGVRAILDSCICETAASIGSSTQPLARSPE